MAHIQIEKELLSREGTSRSGQGLNYFLIFLFVLQKSHDAEGLTSSGHRPFCALPDAAAVTV
jgi:hypothetical protein